MSQAAQDPEAKTSPRPRSVIAEGATFRGDIEGSTTDLHVQGRVVGKVIVGDLVLDADSAIHGSVLADAAVIGGRVVGPVKARSVHLLSTGRLEGDISCLDIQVEDGACLNGRCEAQDRAGAKIIPMTRTEDGGASRLMDAGQELLDIAARLRSL